MNLQYWCWAIQRYRNHVYIKTGDYVYVDDKFVAHKVESSDRATGKAFHSFAKNGFYGWVDIGNNQLMQVQADI